MPLSERFVAEHEVQNEPGGEDEGGSGQALEELGAPRERAGLRHLKQNILESVARTIRLDLDEQELKLLLVAIRQVKHTFTVAEAQSRAAGEPLDPQYQPVQEMYVRLEQKVAAAMDSPGAVTSRSRTSS